jgi:hypothetical protein
VVQSPSSSEVTRWTGWITIAAVLLFIVGAFQLIIGFIAFFREAIVTIEEEDLPVNVGFGGWGIIHIIIGLAFMAAAIGVVNGATWARTLTVVVATASAIATFGSLHLYPVGAVLIIALDVLVIYAVIVHGSELRGRS